MPRLFADDEHGRLERYAVAVYLASHGHLPAAEPVDGEAALVAHGEKLFNQTGCIVCHEKHGDQPSRATLKGLAQKTTHTALAAYLMNPASCDPAGRMPSMNLDKADATSLGAVFDSPRRSGFATIAIAGGDVGERIERGVGRRRRDFSNRSG